MSPGKIRIDETYRLDDTYRITIIGKSDCYALHLYMRVDEHDENRIGTWRLPKKPSEDEIKSETIRIVKDWFNDRIDKLTRCLRALDDAN